MNAPLPVDLLPPSSLCPACGASIVVDPKTPTPCTNCAAVVGSPRRFVDDAGRRLVVRPAFSSGPLRACGRCKQALQRVLVDDVAGCFCGACNVVFIGSRHAARVPVVVAAVERVQVDSAEPPRRSNVVLVAAGLVLVVAGVAFSVLS